MGLPSKEELLLELFYNHPTKQWHFKELKEKTKLADSKLAKWLNKFRKENLILRNKPEKKMPHYISNYNNSSFQNRKKLFAMQKLYESGLLDHLASLKKAKTVIIFGSFVRWDWYNESDVDLFIYGDTNDLRLAEFEMKLHRDIQVFACENGTELKKLGEGLLRNMLQGHLVKGDFDFFKVKLNA